jgi:uncharacterized protein with PhoU and TrkA domain
MQMRKKLFIDLALAFVMFGTQLANEQTLKYYKERMK